MEELKEAQKDLKIGKISREGNAKAELHKYALDSFLGRLQFLIIFVLWEKCRKSVKTVLSITVHKEGDNQKTENYRRISYLMHVINCIAKF